MLISSYTNEAHIWSLAEGRILTTLRGYRAPITAVAVSPDGGLAALGAYNGAVFMFALQDSRGNQPQQPWLVRQQLEQQEERRRRDDERERRLQARASGVNHNPVDSAEEAGSTTDEEQGWQGERHSDDQDYEDSESESVIRARPLQSLVRAGHVVGSCLAAEESIGAQNVVRDISVSADGRYVVVAGSEAVIWKRLSGQTTWRLGSHVQLQQNVNDAGLANARRRPDVVGTQATDEVEGHEENGAMPAPEEAEVGSVHVNALQIAPDDESFAMGLSTGILRVQPLDDSTE